MSGFNRGAIRNRERYFQGYDHSAWSKVLPRNITPSDIDVVFDNARNARVMFCEFSSQARVWRDKPQGQRLLYQQLLSTNNYANASVICYHNTPSAKDIDTLSGVLSFHVMRKKRGEVIYLPAEDKAYAGDLWPDFVLSFYGCDTRFGAW